MIRARQNCSGRPQPAEYADYAQADIDFVQLPGGTWDTMLNKNYLRSRNFNLRDREVELERSSRAFKRR